MTHNKDTDEITLTSGRTFHAYFGPQCLSPASNGFLHYGSDGEIFTNSFTPEEREEIANEMIQRWEAWKTKTPDNNYEDY